MDPDLVKQLNNAHARGIAASGTFAEQHMAMITVAAQNDGRLMNGFLAAQLFNIDVMQEKTAYNNPVSPGLPTAPRA